MDFHHKVSKGLSQLNKPHKNRSKSGGKVEVCIVKLYHLQPSLLNFLL